MCLCYICTVGAKLYLIVFHFNYILLLLIIIIIISLCQEYLEVIMWYFVDKSEREREKIKENTIYI